MFAVYGLSAIFPVVHGLVLYGMEQLRYSMGLYWVVLQGLLYLVGAATYAVRDCLSLTPS